MAYTVGELSRIARVSVRALHHYDAIGLVEPSARSAAGYRLYTEKDLERLQQVLFFRELDFKLEDIARILADPAFDRRKALVEQRALLSRKAERARELVELVDRTLASLDGGKPMDHQEMFGSFDPQDFEEEAQTRWGHTEAYAESKRRTSRYTQQDWAAIRAEADATTEELAAALEAGAAPTGPRAMDAAEKHRAHIDRWFYPCSHAMHVGLTEMYVADARFCAHYARRHPALAEYIRDASRANAERHASTGA